MAIAIQSGRRQTAARPSWVRRRDAENDAGLGAFMVVLLLAGIVVLVISAQQFEAFVPREIPLVKMLSQATNPNRPLDGARGESPVLDRAIAEKSTSAAAPDSDAERPVSAPAQTAETAPAAAASVAPAVEAPPSAAPAAPVAQAAPAIGVGGHARVAHTDGVGVVLHSAPREGARRPAGLLEGASVTVLELAGDGWARVESGRQSGWVPTSYLAPVN